MLEQGRFGLGLRPGRASRLCAAAWQSALPCLGAAKPYVSPPLRPIPTASPCCVPPRLNPRAGWVRRRHHQQRRGRRFERGNKQPAACPCPASNTRLPTRWTPVTAGHPRTPPAPLCCRGRGGGGARQRCVPRRRGAAARRHPTRHPAGHCCCRRCGSAAAPRGRPAGCRGRGCCRIGARRCACWGGRRAGPRHQG